MAMQPLRHLVDQWHVATQTGGQPMPGPHCGFLCAEVDRPRPRYREGAGGGSLRLLPPLWSVGQPSVAQSH